MSSIFVFIICMTSSNWLSFTSTMTSSCTVTRSFASYFFIQKNTEHKAIFMMSAAEPWIRAFTTCRSILFLSANALVSLYSGKRLLLPKIVSQYQFSARSFFVALMNSRTFGKASKYFLIKSLASSTDTCMVSAKP